jgi:hypothetical protein
MMTGFMSAFMSVRSLFDFIIIIIVVKKGSSLPLTFRQNLLNLFQLVGKCPVFPIMGSNLYP